MKIRVAVLLLLAFAGCISGSEEESNKIRETIKRYNQLLSESYMRADMALMEQVVSSNQASRLEHRLDALKMNRIRMEAELKKLEFIEVNFLSKKRDADKAVAKTHETWNVRHVDIKTGNTVKKIDGLIYVMSYELIRKDNEWIVDDAVIVEEKELNH